MATGDIKRWLWTNVRELMDQRWGGENLSRLAKEGRLGPGTAQRIKESETSVGVDIVAKVAAVFRVAPHQLLVSPEDKTAIRLLRVWQETDEKGRLMLETAVEAAEQRRHGGIAGMGKSGTTHDR